MRDILRNIWILSRLEDRNRGLQDRRESGDVVVPEDRFDFRQVGFGEISAGIGWAEIHAADFQRQRIGFRSDHEICAERAKFLRKTITDIERNAKRGGSYGHAKRKRRSRQQFPPRTARKIIRNQSKKHSDHRSAISDQSKAFTARLSISNA